MWEHYDESDIIYTPDGTANLKELFRIYKPGMEIRINARPTVEIFPLCYDITGAYDLEVFL